MAQTKTQDTNVAEDTAERIRELNERIIDAGRKAGTQYLDVYERTLKTVADFQEKAGQSTQVDWITNLANVQANFIRESARAYTDAARELLKK
jgi:hypothetical protein